MYLDDIIITGATDQKHLSNLAAVLGRLREKGFRLKKDKCHFMQTTVEYLGHVIDAKGQHTSPKKCQAITEAPALKNVTELRSFLGLINYYGKFVPNLEWELLSHSSARKAENAQWLSHPGPSPRVSATNRS